MGATGFLQKSRRGILGNVLEEEKNLELKLRATEEIRRMQKKLPRLIIVFYCGRNLCQEISIRISNK
jgi:hypothetical protein